MRKKEGDRERERELSQKKAPHMRFLVQRIPRGCNTLEVHQGRTRGEPERVCNPFLSSMPLSVNALRVACEEERSSD